LHVLSDKSRRDFSGGGAFLSWLAKPIVAASPLIFAAPPLKFYKQQCHHWTMTTFEILLDLGYTNFGHFSVASSHGKAYWWQFWKGQFRP